MQTRFMPGSPVFRAPQATRGLAQLKPANNLRLETRPAPPVYRPNATTQVGQRAIQQMRKPAGSPPYRPVQPKILRPQIPPAYVPPKAPPVHSGNPSPRQAQATITSALQRKVQPTPPPVYRPDSTGSKMVRTAPNPPGMIQPKARQATQLVPRNVRSAATPKHCLSNIQRKIFIDDVEQTAENVEDLIKESHGSNPPENLKKMVSAWHKSNLEHRFKASGDRTAKETFNRAIKRNIETLKAPAVIESLFKADNFLFATDSGHREQTLYFHDEDTGKSGRLRPQHNTGPLAQIDKEVTTHVFLSEERSKEVKKWHKKDENAKKVPEFNENEKKPEDNKYHIEFASQMVDEEEKLTSWHQSMGTIRTNVDNLDNRISTALQNIFGQ